MSVNTDISNPSPSISLSHSSSSSSSTISSPLPPNFPSYINCLNETPRRSFTVAILNKATEYVVCLAQFVYYTVKDIIFKNRVTLFTYERLTADHLNIYFQKFNLENNGAVFTDAIFGILENGDDWSKPGNKGKCHFDVMVDKLLKDNFPDIDVNNCNRGNELRKRHKHILAIPINIGQRHWTVLHIDLNHQTISFLDSKGNNVWYSSTTKKLIKARMCQAQKWLNDIVKKWNFNNSDVLLKAQYPLGGPWILKTSGNGDSFVNERKQYDFWNCGHFIIQMTYIAGRRECGAYNPSKADPLDIPFAEMERQIQARRKDVLATVNPKLAEFAL